jgi:ABC-type dipeptide/oligopeptide/nickel transport system permease subunit
MRISTSSISAVAPPPPRGERAGQMWRQLRRNRLSLAGSVIVLSLIVVALAGPYLGLPSPVRLNIPQRFLPPGAGHWFGTDQ